MCTDVDDAVTAADCCVNEPLDANVAGHDGQSDLPRKGNVDVHSVEIDLFRHDRLGEGAALPTTAVQARSPERDHRADTSGLRHPLFFPSRSPLALVKVGIDRRHGQAAKSSRKIRQGAVTRWPGSWLPTVDFCHWHHPSTYVIGLVMSVAGQLSPKRAGEKVPRTSHN